MKKSILMLLIFTALTAMAGTPQPAAVVYGRVRDAFGFPYINTARILFSKGEVDCAQYKFGSLLANGMNYRVALDLDNGGSPYAPHAVQPGQVLTVKVEVGGVAQPLIPTNRLAVGAPGSSVRLDLCTGTDADGDGLPDEWELLLCEQSGGRLSGVADVNPQDDFDGDGLSNIDEFNAGTFAFIATDLLQIDNFERVAANRIKVRFLTSQGVAYRVVATETLPSASWVPLRFAVGANEPMAYRDLVGDGNYQTIYIESTLDGFFVRLAAQ